MRGSNHSRDTASIQRGQPFSMMRSDFAVPHLFAELDNSRLGQRSTNTLDSPEKGGGQTRVSLRNGYNVAQELISPHLTIQPFMGGRKACFARTSAISSQL
jgi:hypothetical protein